MIEVLEARIAPATLVNPTTVTYQDVDGDTVTVRLSKGVFDQATINAVLTFDVGSLDQDNGTAQQLRLIDFTALATPADAAGTSISVTAKRSADHGGGGFVNVGRIVATGLDLGVITIAGNLGGIEAGDAIFKDSPAIGSLTVQTMGEVSTTTQPVNGSHGSTLHGGIEKLTIKGDARMARIDILGGADAGVGTLTIGGSLLGGDPTASGRIFITGNLGSLIIKGDLAGGSGMESGSVLVAGKIGKAVIGGSVIGGDGVAGSGVLKAGAGIGKVRINQDVRGGTADESGVVNGGTSIGAITIRGSLTGGAGAESGAILAEGANGRLGSVKIGGSVLGGEGDASGYIHASVLIGTVKITHSVIGGGGDRSAVIYAGSLVAEPHFVKGITIGRNLCGGEGFASGHIGTAFGVLGGTYHFNVGKIEIKGSILEEGATGGTIVANRIGSLKVGGENLGRESSAGVQLILPGMVKTGGGALVLSNYLASIGSVTVVGGSLYVAGSVSGGVLSSDPVQFSSVSFGGGTLVLGSNLAPSEPQTVVGDSLYVGGESFSGAGTLLFTQASLGGPEVSSGVVVLSLAPQSFSAYSSNLSAGANTLLVGGSLWFSNVVARMTYQGGTLITEEVPVIQGLSAVGEASTSVTDTLLLPESEVV